MTTGFMTAPIGKNPFKVGDKVVCIEDGWGDLVEGEVYIVTRTTDGSVAWGGYGDAIWTRFRLVDPDDLISSDAGEAYDEAMQAIEAFELVNRG